MTLSDLYSAIKAQESDFPLPQPELTVTLGTLDLTNKILINNPFMGLLASDIVFSYNIQTYYAQAYTVSGKPQEPGRGGTAVASVFAYGGILDIANVEKLNIEILITNWNQIGTSGNLIITLGSKTAQVAYNTPSVLFEGVTETDAAFTIVVNNTLTIGATQQPNSYTLRTILPLKINWSQLAAGAITIPALPIALVYAPPVDPQKKNQASTSNAITAGNTTSITFVSKKDITKPVDTSFKNVTDIQKDINSLGGVLSKIPTPYTSAIGSALNGIANALGNAEATLTSSVTISTQSSIAVTSSEAETITASASDGGPGIGDIIKYLYSVRVIWYSLNGAMTLGILGAEGSAQVTMNELKEGSIRLKDQPAGTIDKVLNIDLPTIEQLQSLDPFTTINPGTQLESSRFTDVSDGVQIIGGGGYSKSYQFSITTSTSNVATTMTTYIEKDSPGFLSIFGLGIDENQTLETQITQSNLLQSISTKTVTQNLQLFGENGETYACRVYFDNIFLCFAFANA